MFYSLHSNQGGTKSYHLMYMMQIDESMVKHMNLHILFQEVRSYRSVEVSLNFIV